MAGHIVQVINSLLAFLFSLFSPLPRRLSLARPIFPQFVVPPVSFRVSTPMYSTLILTAPLCLRRTATSPVPTPPGHQLRFAGVIMFP
ncbi:hypothetical protein FN846DRAFT_973756, partial [Sphaerosporella brunnea]